MNIIHQTQPKYVDTIPEILEPGIIYISEKFKVAIHLCACGCGRQTVTPFNQWNLKELNGNITLRPSIGNFSGEKPYHAHYYITNNKIEWL